MRTLFPCALLSFSRTFTADKVSKWSPVLLVAVLHIMFGAMLGTQNLALHSPLI